MFSAPLKPDQSDVVDRDAVRRLLAVAAAGFDATIVDAGSGFDERTLAVLGIADRVAIVATPKVPALRAVRTFVEAFDERDGHVDRRSYVLNHLFPSDMLTRADVRKALGDVALLEIPHDPVLLPPGGQHGDPGRARLAALVRRRTAGPFGGGAHGDAESEPARTVPRSCGSPASFAGADAPGLGAAAPFQTRFSTPHGVPQEPPSRLRGNGALDRPWRASQQGIPCGGSDVDRIRGDAMDVPVQQALGRREHEPVIRRSSADTCWSADPVGRHRL